MVPHSIGTSLDSHKPMCINAVANPHFEKMMYLMPFCATEMPQSPGSRQSQGTLEEPQESKDAYHDQE